MIDYPIFSIFSPLTLIFPTWLVTDRHSDNIDSEQIKFLFDRVIHLHLSGMDVQFYIVILHILDGFRKERVKLTDEAEISFNEQLWHFCHDIFHTKNSTPTRASNVTEFDTDYVIVGRQFLLVVHLLVDESSLEKPGNCTVDLW